MCAFKYHKTLVLFWRMDYCRLLFRAYSSAVERLSYTQVVIGSNPVAPTIFALRE